MPPPNHRHLEQDVSGRGLGRPKGAERCQPRAAPWVYDAGGEFALKGQKVCVLVLLLLQSVICRGISIPRALPWADILSALQAEFPGQQ